MQLKCVLVDDSDTQRIALQKLLQKVPNVKVVANFSSARDAQEYLKQGEADLLFLDIEMPRLSGFDLLDLLAKPPLIILVSSFTHHALKAFDYDVVDFLQKPISATRLAVAVQRAQERFRQQVSSTPSETRFIRIKTNQKRQTRIPCDKIIYVEALGDYIRVVTTEEKHVILATLKAFIEELPDGQFLRVHKSFIVNLDRIENYSGSVIEINGHKLPLSRRRKTALDQALSNRV